MRRMLLLKKIKIKKRHILLVLLLLVVYIFKVIPYLSIVYGKQIYPRIGAMLSNFSGLFPFSLGDVFIAASILFVVVYACYSIICKKRRALWLLIEFFLWIYVWFYMAWGLNYSQPSIYSRIGMKPVQVSKEEFRKFAGEYIDSLNASYPNALRADKRDVEMEIPHAYLDISRSGTRVGINAPFNNHPHVKTMLFSKLCSMAGVTGSMGPFFCEFTLNSELQSHEYPATYAHELAHFMGISNEGEANFYSYMVCTASHNRAIRFSGYYQILFHVLASMDAVLDSTEREVLIKRIRPEVLGLAQSDHKYWSSRRCHVVDKTQNFFYTLYLHGNNIKDGMKNYSTVVGIIMAWRQHCLHIDGKRKCNMK